MAEARKGKKDETQDTDANVVTGDLLEEVAPPDEALTKLLGELDASQARSNVRVEKRERDNGVKKWVFLFECAPAEFNITDVQQEYGAGDYRVRVYGPSVDGTNHYGIIAAPVISIGEPRGKAKAPAQQIMTPQDVASIVRETLATAMPRQPSRSEMLAELAQMRDLFMPAITRTETPAPPVAQTKSLAEQLQEVITISKLLKGDPLPVGEDGEVDAGTLTLNKGIDLIKTMMEKSAPPAIAPAPAVVVPPMLGNPVALSPDEEEMNLLLNSLLFAAKTNMPIESLAQTVYEKMPDEVFEALLNEQIWWGALLQLMPKAQPYQEYFTRLRARVLELYQADEPENLTPPHATGIESPAKTNGGNVEGQSGAGGAVTRA